MRPLRWRQHLLTTAADAAAGLVDTIAVDGADHNDAVLGAGSVVVGAVRRLV